MSDVVPDFHQFPVKLYSTLVDHVIDETEIQWLKSLAKSQFRFMTGDAHRLAYLLDSQYIGHGLSAPNQNSIEYVLFAVPLANDKGKTEKNTFQTCEVFF